MNDNLTPKAIVRALDAHIIGQADAKRAVAVALRNRWRRQKLDASLRDEVTPKNILMIGPTGCGKTEISRRLAKLADADVMLVITGNGDVLEPEGGIAAIGSGGNYALAAAKALADYEPDPETLARRAMAIAAEVCVFTNDRVVVETV